MFTLLLQLVAMFACCLSVGITLSSLVPRSSSPLSKLLLSFAGGLFLMVLIPQNLVYLGVPVRISAWLMMGLGILQLFRKRSIYAQTCKATRGVPERGAIQDRYPGHEVQTMAVDTGHT